MLSMIPVEELCRKLKPVFGSKIDKLYMQYSLTEDLHKRLEIESTLNALFQKYLNSSMLNEKVLLEPPAKDVIKGKYSLGIVTYADKELYPFGLREQDWIRHVCVTGMSGSGKTNFAFQIIGNLIFNDKPFLVFDWKKSFRPLLKLDKKLMLFTVGNNNVSNLFKFNINKPPKNVDAREWLNFLCDLVSESFNTSFGVQKILMEIMDKAFKDFGVYEGSENYPTWHQIKERLDEKEEQIYNKKGRESEWITSAQRIAHALTFGNFGESINYKGFNAISIEDIFDKKIIFELHALNNVEKKFFCEFILAYIYKYKKVNDQEDKNEFKYSIIVDEAHNIFLKERPNFIKESITDMIYREVRDYGIGLVCLDQHISKLSDTVSGNSACNIAFQQMLPQDVERVSSLMGMIREKKNYFSMIPVGSAIVRLAERYFAPFTVKIPFVELKNKKVSDEEVSKAMKFMINKVKKLKMMEEDMRLENIKKKLLATEKQLHIIKTSGVDPGNELLVKQDKIKKAMEEAMNKKKKVLIKNHLQKDLIEQINELLVNNKISSIKEYFLSQGYKNEDINNAIKYVAERRKIDLNGEKKKKESQRKIPKLLRLTEEEKNFLTYLYRYPNMSISQIYNGLKISARKGNQIKKDIVEEGLAILEEERNSKGMEKRLKLHQKLVNYFENPAESELVIY